MDTEKIFNRFYREDPSRTRHSSGLGLSIVKALMEKMNGDASANFSSGIFSIDIEFAKAGKEHRHGHPLNSNSRRILIVEDDEHINAILHDGLTVEGRVLLHPVYSGSEGILNLAEREYHLIVLDLMLPGLSGEAFMQ